MPCQETLEQEFEPLKLEHVPAHALVNKITGGSEFGIGGHSVGSAQVGKLARSLLPLFLVELMSLRLSMDKRNAMAKLLRALAERLRSAGLL